MKDGSLRVVDAITGIAMRLSTEFDRGAVRLRVEDHMWECSTKVYRGGRLRMIGYSNDFPGDCAEQQTRGCQVRYGFNVFEAYVAKLSWSAILVQYPLDKDLFYALRWEL